ncbi:iron-enterobactin ABC transporter permease [Tatumella saanichensis]|uniref:iron-enterobactin ABC transporter permease n=1 Tax=Tatumella saanichensis TaxID=480813 RepID=UPI0004A36AEA|nr:iron-enterobactin ABC transporter permease [Tatumella saanichensis]
MTRNLVMLLVVIGAICFLTLTRGTLSLSAAQLWQVVTGEAPKGIMLVVSEWRLPRLLAALMTGAALAVSGALFQSLLRNPLGSPDILGFNTGAFSAVLLVMVWLPGQPSLLALAALVGGLMTAVVVFLFSWRQGITTFRLILIGIGIRALLMSLNSWLMTNTSLETALSAGLWSAGSLNGISWKMLPAVAMIILLTLLVTASLVRRLRLLEMGDDMAVALGVPAHRSRLTLMACGVILTAVSTALIGPVSFVALIAPRIAERLGGGRPHSLLLSALCGAVLLSAADYLASHLFIPYQLPVGVVTVSVGGVYLMGLLFKEARRK